jgi:hypothetical protein
MQTIILIVIVLILVGHEWDYRAKRDGKAEATKAMLFAGAVFGTGLLAIHFFGPIGLIALAIVLGTAALILGIRKLRSI